MRKILDALKRERNFQDTKWGTDGHTVGEWILILQTELDEAKLGWIKSKGDASALEEILQVVCVGIACLEQHGIVER